MDSKWLYNRRSFRGRELLFWHTGTRPELAAYFWWTI